MEALKKLPVPVYLLSGNHDPLVADSLFYQAENMENVHVLSDSSPVEVRRGVEIVGAPLTTKRATYDVLGGALGALTPTDAIRIAVGHGQTEARTNDIVPDLINLDLAESKLADASVDYIALGDTHSTQAVGETGRMWYSGAPETTDFYEVATGGGETDSGNVLVVTAGKGTAEVAKFPVERGFLRRLLYLSTPKKKRKLSSQRLRHIQTSPRPSSNMRCRALFHWPQ